MIKLSVGKDVDSYCTKCRLELGHLIAAMVGDKIAKVKCNTCGGVHNYREVKKVQGSSGVVKKTGLSKTKKDAGKAPDVSWETCLVKAKGSHLSYDMGRAFKVGDIISHELFGIGVVLGISTKKCTAIFSDMKRILVTAN